MLRDPSSSALANLRPNGAITTCSFDFLSRIDLYNGEKPYYFSGPLEPSQEKHRTNLTYTQHEVQAQDIRGAEDKLNLKDHGFVLLKHQIKTTMKDPSEDELNDYLDEMASFVQEYFDAELALSYNFRFRKETKKVDSSMKKQAVGTYGNQDKPVLVPHTDQTREGGPRRARHHLTEQEADKYLNGDWRIRILNLWRPLMHSADERPLAMCDYFSVDEKDFVPADRASREYVGEIYYLQHNSEQRWYWVRNQTPEEVLLFVNYDSHPGDGVPCLPHSSFLNNAASKTAKPRQSLETAVIVITKD